MASKERGLYPKFQVERVDPAAQERHKDCWVFVLEPAHDPIARVALKAYADEAAKAGYLDLAADLRLKAHDLGWN